MMQTIIDNLSSGPLNWVAERLKPLTPEVESAWSMQQLTTPEGCAQVLQRYLDVHMGSDTDPQQLRARVSMWSQWYFAMLLPSWVIVSLSHNWQLPIAPERVFLTLQENGLPEQIYFDGPGEPFIEGLPLARFDVMIEQHLRSVCQSMAEISGLKPGIYWSNAGVRIAWGIEQAQLINADARDGLALLEARVLRDGSKNPLIDPVRAENPSDPNSIRYRRQCCLRYELADHEICSTCPLELAKKRRRNPVE